MGMLVSNWTGKNNTWNSVQANIRGGDGKCITEGKLLDTKTAVYHLDRHNPSGDFYPAQKPAFALLSDVVYLFGVFPHKALTAFGNLGWGAVQTASAFKKAWTMRNEKDFSKLEAFKPGMHHLFHGAKTLVVLGSIVALYRYGYAPQIKGHDVFKWTAIGVEGLFTLSSLYNPKGTRVLINKFEKHCNVKPVDEAKAHRLNLLAKVVYSLDGSYSLSRLLNIHRLGNKDDKVGDQSKFEYLEEKKVK